MFRLAYLKSVLLPWWVEFRILTEFVINKIIIIVSEIKQRNKEMALPYACPGKWGRILRNIINIWFNAYKSINKNIIIS